MSSYDLKAQKRTANGKGAAKKLRASGHVPGVAYSKQETPEALSINAKDLWDITAHHHSRGLLNLKFEDGSSLAVIIKSIQRHPVTHNPTSIDFLRVKLDEEVAATVPVILDGEPVGVQEGGILVQAIHELHIMALPGNLPEAIRVDVSALELNGPPILVKEIPAIEGITITTDGEEGIAVVNPPAVEEEPEVEEVDASEVPAIEQSDEEDSE